LSWPDLVIVLRSNKGRIKEFVVSGGRDFELKEDSLKDKRHSMTPMRIFSES
jgi:hypothetical protein